MSLRFPDSYELVLGSESQFRRKVLSDKHIPFRYTKAALDEKTIRSEDPRELTTLLAKAKAQIIQSHWKNPNTLLITGDQVAYKNGRIREKPQSREECYAYLQSYCNSDVELYSSVCVSNLLTGSVWCDVDVSRVQFADIPKSVQDHLVDVGDVMYTCGGITVEDEQLQACITQMDEMDRIYGLPLSLVQEGIDRVL